MPEASQRVEAGTRRTGGASLVSGAVWVNLELNEPADLRTTRPRTKTPALLRSPVGLAATRHQARIRGRPVSPRFTARTPMLE
jgi:hypothetical protein